MEEGFSKKRKPKNLIYIITIAVIIIIIVLVLIFSRGSKEEATGAASLLEQYEAGGQKAEGAEASEDAPKIDPLTGLVVGGGGSGGDSDSGFVTTTIATTTTTIPESRITLAEQNEIISKIIKLREYSNKEDLVMIAEMVTDLNGQFLATNIDAVVFSWHHLVDCVYDGCDDRRYYNLIDDVVLQNFDNNRNKLIHHVAEVYNLWDGKNLIQFSEAVTKVNDLVEKIDNNAITAKWNEVVECDAKCNDFSDLIIDLIAEINSA